ncbi:TPA: BppU family phage baseplate upper protein [Clostridium perfringens]
MAKKDIKFTLDTIDSNYSPVGTVKQLDSVFFYIKITENGVTKDLTGQTIKLFAVKGDKKLVEQTTKINTTNETEGLVEIELLNSAIQVPGFTYFELEISDNTGLISTSDFILRVDRKVGSDEAIESTNEVATLKEIEIYVAQAKVELQRFKELQTEMLRTNETINSNEEGRVSAEEKRVNAENKRALAEEERGTLFTQKEEERGTLFAQKEVERDDTFAQGERERNERFEEAESDRAVAESERVIAEQVREEKFAGFESKISSNTKELKGARTATTGENFDTLDERIDCEIDRLNKKIEVSMLQQEDKENHVIENTVEGMTTDMIVKGMTLQNLWNGKIGNNIANKIKGETTYTIIITNCSKNTSQLNGKWVGSSSPEDFLIKPKGNQETYYIARRVSPVNANNLSFYFVEGGEDTQLKILILEDDWINKPIPQYFEGIKSFGEAEGNKISILSSGKNLLNMNDFYNTLKSISNNGIFEEKKDGRDCIKITQLSNYWNKGYEKIKFKGKTRYTFTGTAFHTSNNRSILTIKYNDGSNVAISVDANGWNKFNFTSDANKTIKGIFSAYTTDTWAYIDKNTFMIEEDERATNYEPYKEYKKDILLSELRFDEGLRGLSPTVCDELNSITDKAIKKIEKYSFTGNENLERQSINEHGIVNFLLRLNTVKGGIGISNKFKQQNTNIANTLDEGFYFSEGIGIYIRVKESIANDVDMFKQLLREWYMANNPLEIYYELLEPVETHLDENINAKSFNEKTYVSFENAISGTSSFKAPVNTVVTIARLNRENRALEEENKNLKQDFESTTLTLIDSDLELVKQNVDMDFRLMEVEIALDIPQAILSSNINFKNKKGEVKNMARSPYEMMKIVILSGDYDREDYMYKVGKYYERGRMTKEEHDELISLMTADEVIRK